MGVYKLKISSTYSGNTCCVTELDGARAASLFLPRRRASDLIAQQTGGIRVPATGGKKGFGT